MFPRGSEIMITVREVRAVASAIVMVCSYASSQWIRTNGPDGGELTDRIAVIPDATGRTDLLAGTKSGIFLSTDKGTSWSPANVGLPKNQLGDYFHASCFAFGDDAVNGKNIFVGFGEGGGLFRSTNNGACWIAAGSGLRYKDIVSLAVGGNGTGGSTLFASTYYDAGLFCSTNNGASWRQINLGLTSQVVLSLAVIPNGEGGNIILAGTPGAGVFRSTNDGTSWTEVNSGIQSAWTWVKCFAVSTNEEAENSIFAATNDGVYLSTNSGSSWSLVGSRSVTASALVTFTDAKGRLTLFGGNSVGAFRSTDGGVSWANASAGLTNNHVMSLTLCDDGQGSTSLFAGTEGGIFRSKDNGENWAPANSGLGYSYSSVGTLVVSASETGVATLVAGTANSGVFLSSNSGINWTAINSGLGSPEVAHLAVGLNSDGTTSTRLIALTTAGISFSTNNGLEWHPTNIGSPYPWVNSVATDQNIGGGENLYAATMNGVFRSSSRGESWERINSGLSDTTAYYVSTTPNATGGTSLWTTVSPSWGVGGLFLSTNGGTNWSPTGLQNPYICSIVVDGKNVFASSGGDYSGGGTLAGIFLSTDDGTSWKKVSPLRAYTVAVAPNPAGGTYLFAGTYESGVYASCDLGASWRAVNVGLPQRDYGVFTKVSSLAVFGQDLYAATQTGVWRWPLSEMITDVEPEESEVPQGWRLFQNYPNPFNPATTIRFTIAGVAALSGSEGPATNVRLAVYDLLGREVAVLVDDEMKSGVYQAEFDGTKFSSGVYIYRLTAGNHVESKRMIMLK
jgi:hypothetical protein